ncbi:MAG: Crp/Fnr family transcriptional regulator [Bacteroidetes bacterium]|jgi:CRP/FNR family transcriptional regulator, polysaccharide utilization system transcription regulator|nr:Crp/Fnr family transcriptional regulator [Bacteroidota bacterium]MBT3749553.1 Crp/Fnr family transcriptional regulator [Bacteroidota bacterium]MBT4401546.1 Crp/Fnr family transcriptional regulator [Bacteroidota bacterium]MBT5425945.1 Crp/Fnr family transcriptional regulator [Bacteroidota bacterium]MBT7093644.1 Crp/Fnr family transcriptional regulator [Bacteroidota bacterium]
MVDVIQACKTCLETPGSVFENLSQEEKDLLTRRHTSRFYKKGEMIYQIGERPVGILCLAFGKVKIIKEGVTGREQIVRLARPVGFIGYRAFFAEENYLASAVAIEDSVVCQFNREDLLATIHKRPEITMLIMKSLANELGISHDRTVNLTQKHIRGRLAESLLFLVNTYGFEEDGMTIRAYLSREDIANLSNMTTSNAIRTLSIFSDEDVLDVQGRSIKVVNESRLLRICELG